MYEARKVRLLESSATTMIFFEKVSASQSSVSLYWQQGSIAYKTTQAEIFSAIARIAMNEPDQPHHTYSICTAHMPEMHLKRRAQLCSNEKDFRKITNHFGPAIRWMRDSFRCSIERVEQTYIGCLGVMRLQNKYSKERMEQCCILAEVPIASAMVLLKIFCKRYI